MVQWFKKKKKDESNIDLVINFNSTKIKADHHKILMELLEYKDSVVLDLSLQAIKLHLNNEILGISLSKTNDELLLRKGRLQGIESVYDVLYDTVNAKEDKNHDKNRSVRQIKISGGNIAGTSM